MQAIVLERIREEVRPLLVEQGVDLVELSLERSGKQGVLRILVDRALGTRTLPGHASGGITLDEISGLSRRIGQHLEAHGLLTEPYLLEVSSPGLDRPLKTEEDFRRAQGELVRIITRAPIDGENTYTGTVDEIETGLITVASRERGRVVLKLGDIAKARRIIEI